MNTFDHFYRHIVMEYFFPEGSIAILFSLEMLTGEYFFLGNFDWEYSFEGLLLYYDTGITMYSSEPPFFQIIRSPLFKFDQWLFVNTVILGSKISQC